MQKEDGMTPIKFTVLMTVYNGGEYLKYAIDSVLAQTYKDFELLIINDCSTDSSSEVIESYNDPRIVIHNNEVNIGQTRSLTLGFGLAKGDYIARIDADDLALPNWLQSHANFIKKNPEYAVVSANAVIINEKKQITKVSLSPSDENIILLRSLFYSPINHGGCVMKRGAIVGCGAYDEQFKSAADYNLWGKLLRAGHKITSIDEVVMIIRAFSGSESRKVDRNTYAQTVSLIMEEIINHFIAEEFTSEEIYKACMAFYNETGLSDEDFDEAVMICEDIYLHFDESVELNLGTRQKWARETCKTAFKKRIYAFIVNSNIGVVRKTARKAIKKFGIFNLFCILYILSFLGIGVLNYIPRIYMFLNRRQALRYKNRELEQILQKESE